MTIMQIDKQIDLIYSFYIVHAQCAEFVSHIAFNEINDYGATQILTDTFVEIQTQLSVKLSESIQLRNRITVADAVKLGIADIPNRLANRLICTRLKNHFGDNLSLCPQIKNGLMEVGHKKDFILPVRENGLIVRLDFRNIPRRKI